METASYVGLSRQTVINQAMDVLANNLANASTTGFKGEQPVFRQYLAQGPNGQTIAYVRDVGTTRDTKQGDLTETGNSLDTGIDGDGYYTVSTQAGQRYTRNGRFQLTAQNQLVTTQGNPVLDDRGNPITLPAGGGPIDITTDGSITRNGAPVAKLGIAKFADQQQMILAGSGLYSTDAAPTPDTTSQVRQGVLERANIQPVTEVTRLMGLQRSYGDIQQIMDSEDSRLKNAIDKLSRVA